MRAKQPPNLLFHVTPRRNAVGITRWGIRRSQALGKSKSIFAAERDAVIWAIAHCAYRWVVHPNDLVVIVVRSCGNKWVRTGRRGIWRSFYSVTPRHVADVIPAKRFRYLHKITSADKTQHTV